MNDKHEIVRGNSNMAPVRKIIVVSKDMSHVPWCERTKAGLSWRLNDINACWPDWVSACDTNEHDITAL